MTRGEALCLPPGHELDAAIAEHCLGYHSVRMTRDGPVGKWLEFGAGGEAPVARYSQEVVAALSLLDFVGSRCERPMLVMVWRTREGWKATAIPPACKGDLEVSVCEMSFPLAVCRAVLAASIAGGFDWTKLPVTFTPS